MRTIHKGIYYWRLYTDAYQYALDHGYPTNLIRSFGRGWAIQLRVSGPYVGPLTPLPQP